MFNYKLGIIGCGNMGRAMLSGVVSSHFLKPNEIIASDVNKDLEKAIVSTFGIIWGENNYDIVKNSKYVLIAVKPQNLNRVLDEIKMALSTGSVIISIVAGISTGYIQKKLANNVGVIRVMPNTPALVGKGMSAISRGKLVLEEDFNFAVNLIKSVGEYVIIDEKYQNIATALSGSGPAYFFMFCKHLIDAGISVGLDPDIARKLVVGTLVGSSKMVRESGKDIDKLIKMVSSPGGTTEAALGKFYEKRIDRIILEAVSSAAKRAEDLQSLLEGG